MLKMGTCYDIVPDVPTKHAATGTLAMEQLLTAAMVKVAGMIPSLRKCKDLAADLGLSGHDVLNINSFDGMTAYVILDKWIRRRGRQATGAALWNALERIEVEGIAGECRDLLLSDVPKEGELTVCKPELFII